MCSGTHSTGAVGWIVFPERWYGYVDSINNGFQYLLLLDQGPVIRYGIVSQEDGVVWGTDQSLGRREHAATLDSLG